MLVLLAVLVGSMQLNMARRAQGHPGSKSLSTVNRDGERAFVAPSRLAWAAGGGNFPDRTFSFSAQTKGTVRLVNAFYVTYGLQ